MASPVMLLLATALTVSACASTEVSAAEPPVVDWIDPANAVELDGGWVVVACEGDAVLLCIERDGVTVGTVSATSSPLDSFDFIDPTDDPETILRAIATDYLNVFEQDRAEGCGADYGFKPIRPSKVTLDGNAGLTYGFSGTMADGSPSELHHQFSTIVDDRFVLIVASAYDEGGCPGPDIELTFTSAGLAEFRPWLGRILQSSPLPDVA